MKQGGAVLLKTIQEVMAETDVPAVLKHVLRCAAAGFVFGHVALFAVFQPSLVEKTLLAGTSLAVAQAGSTGTAVVAACFMFTTVLLSLGSGFLLAALDLKLLSKAGTNVPWVIEVTAGASVVVGSVSVGLLLNILPIWIYILGQVVLVLIVYAYSDISDMTKALLIIFTTLYMSVTCGRMGVIIGILSLGLIIVLIFVLRRSLPQIFRQKPQSKSGCKLLERIYFYSICVGTQGFFLGLGASATQDDSVSELASVLQSVLWVVFLSAGLLGAALGIVAMVGLGPEAAGKLSVGAALVTSVALRVISSWSVLLGTRGSTGGILGLAVAAGVSLGAASVAAKEAFGSRNVTLLNLASVAFGVLVAIKGFPLKTTPLTASEIITVTLVALGAFVLGAPKSPFHTKVKLQRGLLTGAELIKGIGMETITVAAAPIGTGALGVAVLGTAALGKLGTGGVLLAVLLALGSALSGKIGKSNPTVNTHTE